MRKLNRIARPRGWAGGASSADVEPRLSSVPTQIREYGDLVVVPHSTQPGTGTPA
jgi:hypothetical protein